MNKKIQTTHTHVLGAIAKRKWHTHAVTWWIQLCYLISNECLSVSNITESSVSWIVYIFANEKEPEKQTSDGKDNTHIQFTTQLCVYCITIDDLVHSNLICNSFIKKKFFVCARNLAFDAIAVWFFFFFFFILYFVLHPRLHWMSCTPTTDWTRHVLSYSTACKQWAWFECVS